jgi:exodeoxyribonuclease V alpha subunit
MGVIKVECLSIKYHNVDSNYYIIEFRDVATKNVFIGKGKSLNIVDYCVYEITGSFQGKDFLSDFLFTSVKFMDEISNEGIVKFLSSNHFKGVGKALAQKISDTFGAELMEIVANDPTRLYIIPNIKQEQVEVICDGINKLSMQNELIEFLMPDFSLNQVLEIVSLIPNEPIALINKNPYVLCNIASFKQVDKFALKKIGISKDFPQRLITYIQKELLASKYMENTYMPTSIILNDINKSRMFDMTQEKILEIVHSDNLSVKLDQDNEIIYLVELNTAERKIAKFIRRTIKNTSNLKSYDMADVEFQAKQLDLEYNDQQKEAILKSLNQDLSIIVGGPGTGKTTVVNAIVQIMVQTGLLPEDIVLCAPTGKAANRLKEATNGIFETKTLHSLLKISATSYDSQYHRQNLSYRLIIIDEFSMVDTLLFNSFIKAVSHDCKIVIVGDQNQLPSVGPGQLLKDLTFSQDGTIITKLTQVQRQKEDSKIIKLASSILNRDITEELYENKDGEYYFLNTPDNNITNNLSVVLNRLLKNGTDIDDIQVLSARRNGEYINSTTQKVNLIIQNIVNSHNDFLKIRKSITKYKINDRVIQNENNKDKDIYNGDTGKVLVQKENIIDINFYNNIIPFGLTDLYSLDLGYAVTVHKSQGSEYPTVILIINRSHGKILTNELIYTAVTRAKSQLIVLGDKAGFEQAIMAKSVNRNTLLNDYILEKDS